MSSTIGEGRTVEEAVDSALQSLGLRIDQVKYEVIEEKKGRFFGLLGGSRCRVQVSQYQRAEEKIEEILSGMLKRIGVASQVEVKRVSGDFDVEIGTVDSDGLLIGKHGETLHALEHLLNRIIHKDRSETGRVKVDVGGYRERRDDQLRSKALGMARKVKESGREMSTDPLYSPDRRVVHLALTGDSQIRTYTVGDGLYKSVVIAPAGARGGGGQSSNRSRSRSGGRGQRSNSRGRRPRPKE